MHLHGELPSLRTTVRLGGKGSDETDAWYDVKFYPYTSPGADPVFAVTGTCHTVICRCVLEKEGSIEILRWFKDEDEQKADGDALSYNSVEWSRAKNGDPLVCVAGNISGIRVLNVQTGQLVTTLSGHGDDINDLTVSPIDPTILVSTSMDHSLRIWSLDPEHQTQPTAAICYGEGHMQGVLTATFHRKGKYLLSGGMDTRLNLWAIPEHLKEHMGTDKPALIHYPHFSTTEVHTDFVDCVRFYNDLILSRGARDFRILLWRIDNFDPDRDPPDSVPIPPSKAVHNTNTTTVPASSISGTRSAWGGRFQRLLQFELPNSDVFYIRFGLFHEWGRHPVLVAGDRFSCLYFWDLQRLEEEESSSNKRREKDGQPSTLTSFLAQQAREGSTVSDDSSAAAQSSRSGSQPAIAAAQHGRGRAVGGGKRKGKQSRTDQSKEKEEDEPQDLGVPFKSIRRHKEIEIPKISFTFRQCAWSRDGQWCVAVGDFGMITMLNRWEGGVPPPET